jgi:hypothetical protein
VDLFVQGMLWILRLKATRDPEEHKPSVEELRTLVREGLEQLPRPT